MKHRLSALALCASILGLAALISPTYAADGVVSIPSTQSVKSTVDRLETVVKDAGFAIVARVDHAGAAAKADLTLRPTELLIFGNPKGGTPLMQAQQTAGLDLPLKMLAWQDEAGKVWISYNAPRWLGTRHGLGEAKTPALDALGEKLAAMAAKAAAAP